MFRRKVLFFVVSLMFFFPLTLIESRADIIIDPDPGGEGDNCGDSFNSPTDMSFMGSEYCVLSQGDTDYITFTPSYDKFITLYIDGSFDLYGTLHEIIDENYHKELGTNGPGLNPQFNFFAQENHKYILEINGYSPSDAGSYNVRIFSNDPALNYSGTHKLPSSLDGFNEYGTHSGDLSTGSPTVLIDDVGNPCEGYLLDQKYVYYVQDYQDYYTGTGKQRFLGITYATWGYKYADLNKRTSPELRVLLTNEMGFGITLTDTNGFSLIKSSYTIQDKPEVFIENTFMISNIKTSITLEDSMYFENSTAYWNMTDPTDSTYNPSLSAELLLTGASYLPGIGDIIGIGQDVSDIVGNLDDYYECIIDGDIVCKVAGDSNEYNLDSDRITKRFNDPFTSGQSVPTYESIVAGYAFEDYFISDVASDNFTLFGVIGSKDPDPTFDPVNDKYDVVYNATVTIGGKEYTWSQTVTHNKTVTHNDEYALLSVNSGKYVNLGSMENAIDNDETTKGLMGYMGYVIFKTDSYHSTYVPKTIEIVFDGCTQYWDIESKQKVYGSLDGNNWTLLFETPTYTEYDVKHIEELNVNQEYKYFKVINDDPNNDSTNLYEFRVKY